MTIQDAKNIKLVDYLHSLGYTPVKQQGTSLWYKSPLREEYEPSFKVNTDRNLWYDFGMGKGGNIIALAQELYQTDSVPYLLDRIAEQSPSIRPVSVSFRQQSSAQPSFQQLEVVPLSSPALYSYLQERGVNTELAKRECKEVRFVNNGKHYFAIGFPNVSGGYEVRNKFFKGCIAPKEITHIRQAGELKDTCYLFEGFMDYLSFLTLRQEHCPNYPDLDKQDYMVLNSVSNLSKAMYPLGNYEHIHCFLDNDKAGFDTLQELHREYGLRIRDSSHIYSGYKDLNAYLCSKRLGQSIQITQEVKAIYKEQQVQPPKKRNKGFKL
ncbi:toprim domain-containing protein [Bacteroides intestinalis]|uniref:toprim domain-containing protein n=1 Tax=Bacteroides intestinalis TaxID=329854 RepID=UPI000E4EC667|nr:toprim domain-containing protein [Bacteroides intestinalis]RGX83842.1 DNA primase [Bacteroides intestinalis]